MGDVSATPAPETATEEADPRLGTVLQDRYRVVRKLGEGGMGAVYEGEHVLIKKRVAIKFLHPQLALVPEVAARFRREAEAATSISHPNVIECTDMGRLEDGSEYMVLEFLEGTDVAGLMERGIVPLGTLAHILVQACEALHAAHQKGIVHRDLKPDNLFLMRRGRDPNFVKVLDFGISKVAGPGKLTRTGTVMGTPFYMSPEQAQGSKDVDHRSDIYALGCILYEGLTGDTPFDGDSLPMLILHICTQPHPPLASRRPDVPPEIGAIVDRCLAKDPAQRFGSMLQLAEALRPFADELPADEPTGPVLLEKPDVAHAPTLTPAGIPAQPTPYAMQPAPAGGGRAGIIALLVLGVLALGGGVAFAILQANDDEVAAAVPEPEVPAVPAAPTGSIELNVRVSPLEARLELDGRRVSNPLEITPERDGRHHHLEATLEGYEPFEIEVRFDENVRIVHALTPVGGEAQAATTPSMRDDRSERRRPITDVSRTLDRLAGTAERTVRTERAEAMVSEMRAAETSMSTASPMTTMTAPTTTMMTTPAAMTPPPRMDTEMSGTMLGGPSMRGTIAIPI